MFISTLEYLKSTKPLQILEKKFLGSKELGTNVLELHFAILANYDQNVLVLFILI